MAYSTVASSSNGNSYSTNNSTDENVLTVSQEKEFLLKTIFNGNENMFNFINCTYSKIYDNNDTFIPLTSVIYTPNKRFFEKSKFFKQINNNNKSLAWLKKHNILVLIYGITSVLDSTLQTQEVYNDSMLIMDISTTNGCINAPQACVPTIFKNEHTVTNTNDDMINLIRFENSPFNYRLNQINERIKNHYATNYTPINVLVFNDLNSDYYIDRFMKNTINVSLT